MILQIVLVISLTYLHAYGGSDDDSSIIAKPTINPILAEKKRLDDGNLDRKTLFHGDNLVEQEDVTMPYSGLDDKWRDWGGYISTKHYETYRIQFSQCACLNGPDRTKRTCKCTELIGCGDWAMEAHDHDNRGKVGRHHFYIGEVVTFKCLDGYWEKHLPANSNGLFQAKCGSYGSWGRQECATCVTDPCKHGGTCTTEGASHSCKCKFGYTGTNCEKEGCQPGDNWCANNGKCLEDGTCDCRNTEHKGPRCQ